MRRLTDTDNEELQAVLKALIAEDVDVTVREVARRHRTLSHASAFTRNPQRLSLIAATQVRQADARSVKRGPEVQKATSATEALRRQTQRVRELEGQVRMLAAATAGCIRAVRAHGGSSALESFWKEYKAVCDAVREAGIEAPSAPVVDLRPPPPKR